MSRCEVVYVVEDCLPDAWDREQIGQLVSSIVDRDLPSGEYAVTLYLVGDDTIRELNREHRGKDAPTDVLSFPLSGADFVLPPGEPVDLGDVVISYPRTLAQADEYGHSVQRELGYLAAHGVLHILGYDHEIESDRQRMRQREEEALGALGLTR